MPTDALIVLWRSSNGIICYNIVKYVLSAAQMIGYEFPKSSEERHVHLFVTYRGSKNNWGTKTEIFCSSSFQIINTLISLNCLFNVEACST